VAANLTCASRGLLGCRSRRIPSHEPVALLEARLEPLLTPARATALGLYYSVTLWIRLSIVFVVASKIVTFVPSSTILDALAGSIGLLGTAVVIATAIVVGPMGEELLFRGVILPRLCSRLGAIWSIGLTSVLFTLIHYGYGVEGLALVFIYSLVLSWTRLRTGGLGAPIALHMTFNALATVARLAR